MDVEDEEIISIYPGIITYDCTQKIMDQMRRNICQVKIGEVQGTGFFCKIPFPDKENMLPVFITNNHVINDELLKKENTEITIGIKEDDKEIIIDLNIERMKYTNRDYDTTIIEIKEDDKIEDFLELDEKIINAILNNDKKIKDFINETIYIIQYPKGQLSVSYGILKEISFNVAHNFLHKCTTIEGSPGSPILNLNNKIIGLHNKVIDTNNNEGTFLNFPIKDFIKKNCKNATETIGNDNIKSNEKKEKKENKENPENKEKNEIKEDNEIKENNDVKEKNEINDNTPKDNNDINMNYTDAGNKNVIRGILEINPEETPNNILYNIVDPDFKAGIDVYINNKKINMIKEGTRWKMEFDFAKIGQYLFEIIFEETINKMNSFFEECSSVISIDFSNYNTENVTDMCKMFSQCHKLKEIKGLDKFITNKVKNMSGMFQFCKGLEYIDLSNFNFESVTNMAYMFNQCHKLKEIKGMDNFNHNKVKNMYGMFQICKRLEFLDLSNLNTENVANMAFMFNECHKLKEIKGLEKFVTNKVTDMSGMFQECYELENLDLTNFNTKNVTKMSYMFNHCNKLKEIKGINSLNTNKVTDMNTMFQSCLELEYLDVSNFNTENVTKMANMFKKCNKLKEIKGINKFVTNKVTDMKSMFQECKELENLDLSTYNTEKVTDMSFMFYDCNKLKKLNLLNFSIKCETRDMFAFQSKNTCEFITKNKKLLKLYKTVK